MENWTTEMKDKEGNGDLDKTKQETNKSKWKASLEDLAKQRKEHPWWLEDKVKKAPKPNIIRKNMSMAQCARTQDNISGQNPRIHEVEKENEI